MEDNTVCIVAFDKNTKEIKTVTSCDKADAQKYAKYYRSIGYNAKVLTYDELEAMQKKESEERMNFYKEYGWQ